MRIAVVGSFKDEHASEWNLREGAKFQEACQWIGEDIVRHEHSLIVASDNVRTADYHAMEGALRGIGNSTPDNPPLIIVHPDEARQRFAIPREARGDLFTTRNSPGNTFAVTHLFEVSLADAVIVIGGSASSYQAGVSALVAGKRVVPIGSFGGAGARLIDLLQRSHKQWPSNMLHETALGQLRNRWSATLGKQVSKFARISTSPSVLLIHGRSNDWLVLKNFLQNKIGLLEPVAVIEQSMHGLTIAEKFEELAGTVDGAIALVTPDDVGALRDAALSIESLEARARQNVWLEYGWFWGRVGRHRVLMLQRDNAAIPSDLSGILTNRYHSTPEERCEDIRSFVKSLTHSAYA
jgi:hypothetical protein